MASICARCGAGIPPGNQNCVACGAPANAETAVAASAPPATAPSQPAAAPAQPAATPFQPVAPAYQPVAAPAQSTAAPARSGGGSAVKIILIIVAIFVGLGILGVGAFGFMVWRVSRAIHVSSSGNGGQVTLNTPGGKFSANSSTTFTASELGTDIYPGAQAGHGGVRMSLPTGSWVTGIFLTTDSKDKVVDFYKDKFGSGASVFDTADGAVLTLSKGQQESVMVTVTAKPNENEGKTQITITHTKTTKPS